MSDRQSGEVVGGEEEDTLVTGGAHAPEEHFLPPTHIAAVSSRCSDATGHRRAQRHYSMVHTEEYLRLTLPFLPDLYS